MLAEGDIFCEKNISVQFVCVPKSDPLPIGKDFFDVSAPLISQVFLDAPVPNATSLSEPV